MHWCIEQRKTVIYIEYTETNLSQIDYKFVNSPKAVAINIIDFNTANIELTETTKTNVL